MILRKGSKGQEVKELQKFLGLTADGIFGPITERAVQEYQRAHELVADGIVGPQTLNSMGFLSTDLSEKFTENGELNVIEHHMPAGTYFKGPVPKEWIFLHHTAGWDNPYQVADMWARDKRGNVATEFILGGQNVKNGTDKYDGDLVQAFPEGGYGWHTGTGNSRMHRNSVAIEVCNMGYIENGKTYVGTIADPSQVVKLAKPFKGHQYWHRYSDKQIEVLKKWILHIANKYSIDPRVGLVEWVKEKGADGFEVLDLDKANKTPGLYTHSNVVSWKSDMFPQQELIDMLLSL